MIDLSIRKKLWSASGDMELEISTTINKGSFVCLHGKSGSGKTTTLRILAGLTQPDWGVITVNGAKWFDGNSGFTLQPGKRKIGFVFQDYALFPNMTVRENLLFAAPRHQPPSIVDDVIEAVELGDLKSRKPAVLSGGQKQRVAVARALVQRPGILLLDEPLSALDPEIRIKLQQLLARVHREFELTTIIVSHDVSEILRLADRVITLEQGKMVSSGSPVDVFTHRSVSGKFQFVGEVIKLEQVDFLSVLSVLIGNDLVRVVVNHDEAQQFTPGDSVLVASKAFNPIVRKL